MAQEQEAGCGGFEIGALVGGSAALTLLIVTALMGDAALIFLNLPVLGLVVGLNVIPVLLRYGVSAFRQTCALLPRMLFLANPPRVPAESRAVLHRLVLTARWAVVLGALLVWIPFLIHLQDPNQAGRGLVNLFRAPFYGLLLSELLWSPAAQRAERLFRTGEAAPKPETL